jgi:hypothetical protein
VKEMIFTREKLGSKWVVPCQKDLTKCQTSSAFSHYFKNIFNYKYGKGKDRQKNIGATVLRRVHCSENIDKNVSAKQRNEDARIMGHSTSTANKCYSKYSTVLHPPEEGDSEKEEENTGVQLTIEPLTTTEPPSIEQENKRLKRELADAKAMIRQLSLMVSQLSK